MTQQPVSATPRPPLVLPRVGATVPRPGVIGRARLLERYEPLLVVAFLVTLYLALSAYVIIDRDLRGGDPASRLLNAYLVTHGEENKLASMGFIFPPLLTLVLIPVAAVPPLFESFYAVGIVSSLFMGLAAYFIWRSIRLFDYSWRLRLLLTALFALNPMVVVFAINGMGEAIAYAMLTGAVFHLLRLERERRIQDVALSAIFFGLASVSRYELAILTVVVGIGIFVRFWREERRPRWGEDFTRFSRASGAFLAFVVPAAYPMLMWMLANWLIMGHPMWFVFGGQGILQTVPPGAAKGIFGGIGIASTITLITFPTAFVAGFAALIIGLRKRSAVGASLGAIILAVPAIQMVMLAAGAGLELIRYYTLVIPLSFGALLYAVSALQGAQIRIGRFAQFGRFERSTASAVLVFLLVAGAVVGGVTLNTTSRANIEASTWFGLQGKRVPPGPLDEGVAVGRAVNEVIPSGQRVLVDYFGTAYTVRFGLAGDKTSDFTSPDFVAATKNPWSYVDWVLVPEPVGRQTLNPIHVFHPEIYLELSPIAEKVLDFPETANKWKLFRLNRESPAADTVNDGSQP